MEESIDWRRMFRMRSSPLTIDSSLESTHYEIATDSTWTLEEPYENDGILLNVRTTTKTLDASFIAMVHWSLS